MSNFFVAGNKIDIKQESISIPSNNGLNYSAGQLIELKVDPQVVKFFQPKNSYLQFDVKLQMPTDTLGTLTRLVLDSHIGAQSLIREIRIFDGMNNALLEEIVGYNVNCMVKYDYHCNESLRQKRALTEGAGGRIAPFGQLGTEQSHQNSARNPYADFPTDSVFLNGSYQNCKVCLPLNTGIFQNDKVFPCMLTNGLRISILLEDNVRVARLMEGTMVNRKTKLNPFIHSQNGCVTTGSFVATTNYTEIYLTQDNGYTDTDNFPFVVGESIGFYKTNPLLGTGNGFQAFGGDFPVITDIELVTGTELLKLTTTSFSLTASLATNINASSVIFTKSVDIPATYNSTYTVSNVELVLQKVDMGNNYEADMIRRMKEGGTINYDFLSVTNYRYSQLAGDIVANIQLPIENRRMKSVICVPTDATNYSQKQVLTASGTYVEDIPGDANYIQNQDRCGLAGISDAISSYQFLYDGRLQPSRLVDCAKTSSKKSVSQQHLIELEKALTSAGISGQSMLEFNRNFVIGRAVAVQNGIYDGRNRQFSLQVNYNGTAPTKNKLWNSFVHHIRRLVIAGDSISVEV